MQRPETTTVEEFLAGGGAAGSELLVDIGRVLEVGGLLVATGLLVFAIWCLPERRLTTVLENVVMVAGLIVVVGAITELSGSSSIFGLEFIDVLTDGRLDGARFRFVAGTVLAFSVLASERWRHLPFLAGALLGATSFGLDGHSVSEGPRLVMAVVNLTHVVAAGVWSGGTVGLLLTVLPPRAANGPEPLGEVARRFSVVATVVLVPVLVSGVTMAIMILDSWSELFSTSWGRVFLIKLATVAAALAIGAHHHFRVVPSLDEQLSEPAFAPRVFRRSLAIETALLGTAAVVTALLVSASTA